MSSQQETRETYSLNQLIEVLTPENFDVSTVRPINRVKPRVPSEDGKAHNIMFNDIYILPTVCTGAIVKDTRYGQSVMCFVSEVDNSVLKLLIALKNALLSVNESKILDSKFNLYYSNNNSNFITFFNPKYTYNLVVDENLSKEDEKFIQYKTLKVLGVNKKPEERRIPQNQKFDAIWNVKGVRIATVVKGDEAIRTVSLILYPRDFIIKEVGSNAITDASGNKINVRVPAVLVSGESTPDTPTDVDLKESLSKLNVADDGFTMSKQQYNYEEPSTSNRKRTVFNQRPQY